MKVWGGASGAGPGVDLLAQSLALDSQGDQLLLLLAVGSPEVPMMDRQLFLE